MSCGGCGGTIELTVREGERLAELAAQHGAIEARRVMCLTCPNRRGAAWATPRRPIGKCSISGSPISLTIAGVKPCPQGRHPDPSGRVRWLGMSWLGVPMPLRWIAAALGRERGGIETVDHLPGCGCIERLKVFALRMAGKLGRA